MDIGGRYRIEVDEVVSPGGKTTTYSVVRMHPYSVIIPIDAKGKMYMVRQHRYTTDTVMLEFPMGSTDGEDPLAAAKRELEEESELESDEWIELGRIQELKGISDSTGYLYLVRNVKPVLNPKLDPEDKDLIERLTLTADEVRQKIAKGEINDASTICAFTKAEFMGLLKK